MLIGAAAGAVWAVSQGWDTNFVVISAAGAAISAIVPDIDHPQGHIRQRMGILSGLLDWLPHRGITHSLAMLIWWALAMYLGTGDIRTAMPGILGYASHLIADMMTKSGIPLFLPFHAGRIYALPRLMRLRTAGISEQLIAGVAALLLLPYIDIGQISGVLTTVGGDMVRWYGDAVRLFIP
jgi:inner membrane protein